MAEDVPELVAMNDPASLSSMDMAALRTRVVHKQQATIDPMQPRLDRTDNKET